MYNFFVLIIFAVIVGVVVTFTQPIADDLLNRPGIEAQVAPKDSSENQTGLVITRTPTERKQAQWVAKHLGGTSKYYFPQGSGWAYNSRGQERVTFAVPKGVVVDTSRGLRYEGQEVQAREFTVWWL